MTTCQFSNPVNVLGEPATGEEFWIFQNASCDSTQFFLIQNATTEAEFYLDKTINYGDLISIFLLSIILLLLIFKGIAHFVFNLFGHLK